MSFTVVWDEAADDALAAIWSAADDRTGLTRAALSLEHRLRIDPGGAGESRDAGERVAFEKPLAVRYLVMDEHLVRILHVWSYH